MLLINFLVTVALGAISSVVLSAVQLGTGIQNHDNICYMNALISCLYDVTPFRKAVYDNYQESVIIRALAGVFGRKQLNMLPSIDINDDMMATIQQFNPDWGFGATQDIDEFFKMIFVFFPPSITSRIGFSMRERLSTLDRSYRINEGTPTPTPMIFCHLPDQKSNESLDFQELLNGATSGVDIRNYRIRRDEHPQYFLQNNISPEVNRVEIEIQVEKLINQYADVVPVFIGRRTGHLGSTAETYRDDKLHNMEIINLPVQNGTLCPYTLTAFAVYVPGHYYAYTKKYPTREWLCYNDSRVSAAAPEEVAAALQKNAVMLFYVKQGASVATEVPPQIKEWSIYSMILQHMSDKLYRRVEKMADKFSR